MDPTMAAWGLLLLFTAKWPGGNPVQRSFSWPPGTLELLGMGVDVSMGRTDQGGSGTVAEAMFVLKLWVLIVAVWWLGSFTEGNGECGGLLGGSRARAGEGQQGRMFG